METNLHIYATSVVKISNASKSISLETFVNDIKSIKWGSYFRVYDEVCLYCKSFHRFPKRFVLLLLCWLLAKRKSWLIDEKGNTAYIGVTVLFKAFKEFIADFVGYQQFLRQCLSHLDKIDAKDYHPKMGKEGVPYYVRNDYVLGFIAGGSIGHIAGIANNLFRMYDEKICFVTSDYIPTLDDSIHEYVIEDNDDLQYSNIRDITSIYYNIPTLRYLRILRKQFPPRFIYHRSALNEYSAVEFAIENNIPLILEYNGSEVWIRKNWAHGKFGALDVSAKIEQLSFKKATLIVCVSKPLKDQLIAWGVDSDKIIVVPNGVDTDKYHPDIDGNVLRDKLHISKDEVVVGFIGTFGVWHGTDVLAQAAVEILEEEKGVRFLFIGDGMMMPKVRSIIDPKNIDEKCIFSGIVPQEKGRDYLAACDILVSPTVPNPDGTPFFGSPTKLFEYMAMGKAIVVSDMDQMAEICEHEKTALLTPPGDEKELKKAILRLIGDKELRIKLGVNARKEACSQYTWEMQTRKIITEFEKRCNQ